MLATEMGGLSVQDYHRLVEAEMIAPDEQVELIERHLFQMAATRTADSATKI